MKTLTEEAMKAVAEMRPAMVATASRDGRPNVSAKGSIRVLDERSVAFADVASPRTMANLRENPLVSILCLDTARHRSCRIWGTAELLSSGPLFEELGRELAGRSMVVKSVVRVTVQDFELS